MTELIDACEAFVSLLEDARPKFQIHRDDKLGFASRRVRMIFRKRFAAQRKSVLGAAFMEQVWKTLVLRYPWPRGKVQEAEGEDKAAVAYFATTQLAPIIYAELVNAKHVEVFAASLTKAINAGAEIVSDHLSAPMPDTGSFVANYVRDNGLTKLTGGIDDTTVKRLAAAIADAYESGADFDGMVKAVKAEFTDFSTKRLTMISQTELNAAFNQSVLTFGREAGAIKKSWQTDLSPCPQCIENAMDGEIPIEEPFTSGDQAAPLHPNCLCSVLVHADL